MKKITHTLLLFMITTSLSFGQAFITTWKTDNPGASNDNQITLPTSGSGYNYDVDWGDGSSDTGVTGNITHTYSSAGTFTVSITGNFPRIYFNNDGDKEKILTVEQWGNIAWTSMADAFFGCSNLDVTATDAPNLSGVTSLYRMFGFATVFNGDIGHWNVSTITDMSAMFAAADNFNQDISSWDVSNVTSFHLMFDNADSFNQDISAWNVSNATAMSFMFRSATSFNQPLNDWDVSSVQAMNFMFFQATSFNQDLGDWDVSSVTNMADMFNRARAFSYDIGDWNTAAVTNMSGMFYDAEAFDHDLANWNIELVTNMSEMFDESGLSTTSYDNTLIGWSGQTVQNGVSLGASTLNFCNSSTERDDLINNDSWIITDAGQECLPFVTTWKTDNPGSSASNQITIPTTGTGYNYTVDWGDGSSDIGVTGNITHTYATAGTFTVSISGDFPRIFFSEEGDKDKIISVEQWGNIQWTSMFQAFQGCSNLVVNATDATDAPDLSGVTSLRSMFEKCSLFNTDINHWDVSNVEDMLGMFYFATSFNQDLNNWDVSNVTNMGSMFGFASIFNGNISNWDVSNVTTFGAMFSRAFDFNQDISGWNVSSASSIGGMFLQASDFNQDISGWNVSNVSQMNNVFKDATSFNHDLSGWDVTSATNMTDIFNNSGLSTTNYDNILEGWAAQSVQSGVTFGAIGVEYCLGATARNILETTHSWTITDGGENCVLNIPDANFKSALLANGSINTDGDPTEISYQEAEVVNNLQIAGLNISDLTGIEAFTALNVLAANSNNLTSIDLTNNESLDYLSLSGNDLVEIDLSDNPTLIEVILSNNQLTEIDLSNNAQITTLWVDQNDLSSIDISNNLLLEDLRVDRNPNLSSLNISANDQLTDLHAYSCNLQNINVSSNTLLKNLFLYANDIISLDLSGLSDLDDLRVGGLSITNLDLSDSPNLRFLRASGMGLTELNLAGTNLVQLFIGDNNLNGSLDLSIYPNLTNVRLEQNNFTDIDLRNGNNGSITNFSTTDNPNLTCISVDDIAFAEANFTSKDSQTFFSTNCSNTANDITVFSFAEQASAAIIGSGVVDIEVTLGTDLSSLSPTFTVSAGATADPASGIAQDFSSAFIYTVTAENPTAIQQWTINVTEENVAPTDIALDNNSIDENNVLNAVIGSLSSADGNASDTHSYSLVAGTGDVDNSSFDISGSNLVASEVFDFETKTSYSVRIQTSDGRGGTFEKEFAIAINDIAGQAQTITITPIIDKIITDGPFDIEASASSGLALIYDISGPATLNGTTITLDGTPGTVTITVAQAGNEDYLSAEEQVSFDVLETKATQTITFNPIEDQFLADESLSLTATASSELEVTYEIVSGPASVSGNVVTFTGLGVVTVRASQDGSSAYLPAEPVEQSFEIIKASQTITFNTIEDQLFSNGSLELSASASSGLEVAYEIISGPATVSDNVVTFTDLGEVIVSALQAGNEVYSAAASVEQSFTIFKNEQTISFNAIEDQFFEAGSLNLSATASSGLAVSYELVSGPAALSGNVVSFSDLGTVVVNASQAGNNSFLAAAAVEQSFDIITVTGVDDVTSALLIYPNPATDILTIQTQQEDVSIQLLNMNGTRVMSIKANAPNSISHLSAGIYFLRISAGENYTTHKIIKK